MGLREPMIPGQRRYARRLSGFGVRKGSLPTGHMLPSEADDDDDINNKQQPSTTATTTTTRKSVQTKRFNIPPINTTNHSGRSSHSSEMKHGLRHEGAFETVRGSDAPRQVVISVEGLVSRFAGNLVGKEQQDIGSSMDDESISDAAMVFSQQDSRKNNNNNNHKSNNNSSDLLHTSSGNASSGSSRPSLLAGGGGGSSRLSLGGSLANITRRLSSIGTGGGSKRSKRSSLASKRSSLASKRSSMDTNQDSVREEAEEEEPFEAGMNLAQFGARTARRSFSVPTSGSDHKRVLLQASSSRSRSSDPSRSRSSDPSRTSNHSIELQDLLPRPPPDTSSSRQQPARRHSSASQKDAEEISKLIVGFNGSGCFSSSGEGSMRSLDLLKGSGSGSRSAAAGSGSAGEDVYYDELDRDLHESGNDSWQSLGSLDSLGLPLPRRHERPQRRRSSLLSVGETAETCFEAAENDAAIKQLRRASMDHPLK